MKIRTGRRNQHNLYLQLGNEPSDTDDPCIGFMLDGRDAALIADGLTSPWHLNEMKIDADLRSEDDQ